MCLATKFSGININVSSMPLDCLITALTVKCSYLGYVNTSQKLTGLCLQSAVITPNKTHIF